MESPWLGSDRGRNIAELIAADLNSPSAIRPKSCRLVQVCTHFLNWKIARMKNEKKYWVGMRIYCYGLRLWFNCQIKTSRDVVNTDRITFQKKEYSWARQEVCSSGVLENSSPKTSECFKDGVILMHFFVPELYQSSEVFPIQSLLSSAFAIMLPALAFTFPY